MTHNGKTRLLAVGLLAIGLSAGFAGGVWFAKKRLRADRTNADLVLELAVAQREAEAYLRCFEALDGTDEEAVRRFRLRGQAVLGIYVRQVDKLLQSQASNPFPIDQGIYERARKYLDKQ